MTVPDIAPAAIAHQRVVFEDGLALDSGAVVAPLAVALDPALADDELGVWLGATPVAWLTAADLPRAAALSRTADTGVRVREGRAKLPDRPTILAPCLVDSVGALCGVIPISLQPAAPA
jgi:hypothetical protein